ncbi:unnamed protein product [Symbiodinium necroappetens]|uniref:Uncharacterized protein n=1 Tax=Symbiodinium necroappetens TaxID=1628268 RepID=A0A813APB7_9DINO|nr:unnamed protein product [Symbiodinium necroappetens]
MLKAHPSTWTSTMFQGIQQHTVKGSSYTSRILLYVLPHNLYKGKKNRLWDLVMDTVTRDMEQLFHRGVQVDGATFYPVLIAAKGDSPALIKLFKLGRSFTRWEGKAGVCPYCLAGQPGIPWEDLTKTAAWRSTRYTTRPWSRQHPPSIASVPFSDVPERCIRPDLMHMVKLGIGRHFLASAIVCLGEWSIFDDGNKILSVEGLLDTVHQDFEYCCKHELKQTANLKQFTKDLLHWPRRSSYPWGGWKASDTMILLRWLLKLVTTGPVLRDASGRTGVSLQAHFAADATKQLVCCALQDGASALLRMFQILYKTDVWLDREAATAVADAIDLFANVYCCLAGIFHREVKQSRFHMEPTLHHFAHVSERMREVLATGANKVLSPACFLCEQSEDFVGRISRLARRCAARTCGQRTLQRYLIKVCLEWERA